MSYYPPSKVDLETEAAERDRMAIAKIIADVHKPKCPKCKGFGWLWGHELEFADEDTRADTMTKYSCDECSRAKEPLP